MQIVKIKYSVENIKSLDLIDEMSAFKLIEVLEIFRYHRLTFSTLQRITFEPGVTNYEKLIDDVFKPAQFQILERKGNEILCFIKVHKDKGYWPKAISGNWTLVPPIIIDKQYVKESLLVKDNFEKTFKMYKKVIKDLEIIAINKIENLSDKNDMHTYHALRKLQPLPHFPSKQNEIALFATRNGYYESPKKVSAKRLAEQFNISVSAVNEHLRKAEQTAMKYFFS